MESKATTIARILLGFIFFFFGLNGYLHFLPQPPMAGPAAQFMGGLAASGYFFPLLMATELVAGIALLARRFVPLGLVALAPVIVNIVAFHLFLAPAGFPLAILVFALGTFLVWSYRSAFRPLLKARHDSAALASEPANRVKAA